RGGGAGGGFATGSPHARRRPDAGLRRFPGPRPGVGLLGRGSPPDRLWTRPAIAVLGIDAPPTSDAATKLVPVASARISVRLAPGDDTQRAFRAVDEHLRRRAPSGAAVAGRPC